MYVDMYDMYERMCAYMYGCMYEFCQYVCGNECMNE